MVGAMLRGAGQVMFQDNAAAGALFLGGVAAGAFIMGIPEIAAGAVIGLVVSTLAGMAVGGCDEDARSGVYGFNGILVGCALPLLLGPSAAMWGLLVAGAVATPWVRRVLNRLMERRFASGSLTLPFVLTTWVAVAAARLAGRTAPSAAGDSMPDFMLLEGVLKGVSQVFLIDSWLAGLLFIAGLAAGSWRAALWAVVGSVAGLCAGLIAGAGAEGVASGLWGYNPVLTAIALFTVFPSAGVLRGCIGILLSIALVPVVSAVVAPLSVVPLTAPFCIAVMVVMLKR